MAGTQEAVPKFVTVETDLPEDVAEALKKAARQNYRSARMELRAIVESHLKAAA